MFNLNELSLSELKKLLNEVNKAISNYNIRRRAEALAELDATAKKLGFSLTDFGLEGPRKRKVSARRFQNPDDPSVTWSGRGRQPRWFRDALSAGRTPESLAMQD